MIQRPKSVLTGCSVLPPMESQAAATPKPIVKAATLEPQNKAAGDRFAIINNFVDFTLGSLSESEVAVWLVLWRDTKDGTARTAQTDIARRAGIGLRTVVRTVGILKTKGLLVTVYRGGLNRGLNVYRVLPLAKLP